MTIIKGKESMMEVFTKMSEGNPGAVTTMMEIWEKSPTIDPDNLLGGLGPILAFDTYGIYGTDIYILWNDQCDRNTRELLMLMRATQLGFFSEARLKQMAGDQSHTDVLTLEEMSKLNDKVMKEVPNFQPRGIKEVQL